MSYLSRDPVLSKDEFVGRAFDLQWVSDMLDRASPQNCNIIGEPRIGKTSFLYQIMARQFGMLPGRTGLHVWLRLATLPDYQPYSFWRLMFVRLRQSLKKANISLTLEAEIPEDERDLFDELDELIERLITETDCGRIIVLIDDFDLLVRGISSRDLDWLRSLATRYADAFAFVISSSDSLVTLTEKLLQREAIEVPVSPFANMFHNRTLGLLTRDEAIQLCHETAVAEKQAPLNEEDLHFLLHEAGQHPALLKMACRYLFEARQYGTGQGIYQDVRGDVRLDEHVTWLCRQLWQRRTKEEQTALVGLVRGDTEMLDPILHNRLKKHLGLIKSCEGNLMLFSEAFAYWIQRELQKGDNTEQIPRPSTPADDLTYLPEQRLVYLDDREVRLTSLEGRLLSYFTAHKNEVCTVDALLANVWGPGKTRSVVEKAVNRLRIKIEQDPKRPRFILSARGEGYLFRLE